MGIDVDYIAGKRAIDELLKLFGAQERGQRAEIANEIIEFVEKLKAKWGEKDSAIVCDRVCTKCGCSDYSEWEELEYENGVDDPMYGGALIPIKFTRCANCD